MKKILYLFLIILACIPRMSFSQNTGGKTDDLGRISLTPVVSDEVKAIPAEAKAYLANKLQQIATLLSLIHI